MQMRMTSFISLRGAAAMMGACAVLAACAKKDATTDTTAMGMSAGAMTTTASGGMMGDSGAMTNNASSPVPASTKKVTDAEVLQMMAAINQGEVDAGNMAKAKATNHDVKEFAEDMVKAHTGMMKDGKELATKIGAMTKPMADDSIVKANMMAGSKLASTAKGAAFDKAYIDAQVMGHTAVVNALQGALPQIVNEDLKKKVGDAIPDVQKHLDKAKEIQAKMGTAM